MAQNTIKSLQQLGCPDCTEQDMQTSLATDTISEKYVSCVVWLCGQLTSTLTLEEAVHPVNLQADNVGGDAQPRAMRSFLLEVSGMLRALECPYPALMDVPLEQKLATPVNRLLALDFLITELQAARMCIAQEPQHKDQRDKPTTAVGELLQIIGEATGMSASTAGSPEQFFQNACQAVEQANTKYGKHAFGQPFLVGQQLSQDDWQLIEKLNDTLNVEYRARRQMLLKRIDVTLSSFSWAGKAQGKSDELKQKVMPIRSQMTADSYVPASALVAARDDLLLHEKTTSAKLRATTKSVVNKVLMGAVPDRGGRCDGTRPGDNHMPSFQARREGPGNFVRGGRGRGGFHRGAPRGGGRVQGGWARGRGGNRRGANNNSNNQNQSQEDHGGDDGQQNHAVYRRNRHQDAPDTGDYGDDGYDQGGQEFYGDDGGDAYDYNVTMDGSGNGGGNGGGYQQQQQYGQNEGYDQAYPQMMDVSGGGGNYNNNQQLNSSYVDYGASEVAGNYGGGGQQHQQHHRGGHHGGWRGGRGGRRGGRWH